MNIHINTVYPTYFTPTSSEVWGKNFSIESESSYLVKAASGGGKSSFFNFLYGLNTNYKGHISFDDIDIASIDDAKWTHLRREQLSIVFQGLRLFPELTALENIQLKNQLTHHKSDAAIKAYMERLDVAHVAHQKAETLSYGQRQRIAIIRALCQPFKVLLLDEPFSHIDKLQIQNAVQLIQEEIAERSASMLIASLGNSYKIDFTKIFSL